MSDGSVGLLLVVPVAQHHVVATNAQLTFLTAFHRLTALIHYLRLQAVV